MTTELPWLGAALAAGLFAQTLRLPVFVGFLLTGLLLGAAGQHPTELLLSAGHVGVLLLLFAVGLHLRPRNLLSQAVLVGGSLHLVISLLLFSTVSWLWGLTFSNAAIWGMLLSFSSTVLAAKTLEASGELGAFHGRVTVGILILQDIAAVAIMIVFTGTAPSLWALALLPGAAALHWLLPFVLARVQSDELLLLLAVLLALGIADVFNQLGLSAELGAITAGALVAVHPRGDTLAERLWGIKELLLVGFFVGVGMRIAPSLADWAMAVGFALLLPFKTWLFFALLVVLGLRARTAFLSGVSLTSYSEFTLIAGSIAQAQGLLPLAGLSVLTLAAVISFVLYLPLNRLNHALYDRFQHLLAAFERDVPHPDDPVASIGAARYLVLGMGRTGTAAYDFLVGTGENVAGLDVDPEILARHLRAHRRAAYGDAQDSDLWRGLNLASVRGAVVALPHANERRRATQLLRKAAPHLTISTYAMHAHESEALAAAGADHVSYLLAEAGERLAELSLEKSVH